MNLAYSLRHFQSVSYRTIRIHMLPFVVWPDRGHKYLFSYAFLPAPNLTKGKYYRLYPKYFNEKIIYAPHPPVFHPNSNGTHTLDSKR